MHAVERLRADRRTQVVVAAGAMLAVVDNADRLLLVSPAQADELFADEDPEWFYLGHDGPTGYLAVASPGRGDLAELPGLAELGGRAGSLRDLGHLFDARDAGLATAAVALTQWRRTHRHCPRCGTATDLAEAGWSTRCPSCGSSHYPRTDPAVIMAVHDGAGRLLLARSVAWPPNRRSVLAGFVEAGEGLEAAVRREVAEEVRLTVGAVQYAGAQPWPFPASLMVAFHAWVEPGAPLPDGVEITHADWYTRAELLDAVTSGVIGLPMRTSIARALIEAWYGGQLPD